MQDKHLLVRNHLLDLLENGNFSAGDKFPGARRIAEELGVSFLLAQHVVNGLVQDGVLVSIPRKGVYIRKLWKARRIWNHFVTFNNKLPYLKELGSLMKEELPELRCCSCFHTGIFEIRPTLSVQCNRNSYLDLSPFFDADDDRYFSNPFSGFRDSRNRLFGIPFLWSPRILLCNRKILAAHGIQSIPQQLDFATFIAMLKELRAKLAPEKLCNYADVMSFYMNMIFGSGGAIIEHGRNNQPEVKLDSPETVAGITALRQLRQILDVGSKPVALSLHDKNEMAFLFADRECVCMLENQSMYQPMRMPEIVPKVHKIFQSTELVCVRRECTDMELAGKFVRFMMGKKVQELIGRTKYGIPTLKEAASGSLDLGNPIDELFFKEAKYTTTGKIDSKELLSFAYGALLDAVASEDEPASKLKSYADAMRLICQMRNNDDFKNAVRHLERDAAAFNLEAVAFDR